MEEVLISLVESAALDGTNAVVISVFFASSSSSFLTDEHIPCDVRQLCSRLMDTI